MPSLVNIQWKNFHGRAKTAKTPKVFPLDCFVVYGICVSVCECVCACTYIYVLMCTHKISLVTDGIGNYVGTYIHSYSMYICLLLDIHVYCMVTTDCLLRNALSPHWP